MTTFAQENGALALVSVLLVGLMWQALHIVRLWVTKKMNGKLSPEDRLPTDAPSCPWSVGREGEWQAVMQAVAESHEREHRIDRNIAAGDFACVFHGRDEVRDILDELKHIRAGIDRLTTTMERQRR